MESTCEYGKIQVSEKTAKCLNQDAERENRSGYKLIEKGGSTAKREKKMTTWKLQLGQELIKLDHLSNLIHCETKKRLRPWHDRDQNGVLS